MKCPFCEKSIDKWTAPNGAIRLTIGEECECPFCCGELIATFVEISYYCGGMVLVPRDDDARWKYEKENGWA